MKARATVTEEREVEVDLKSLFATMRLEIESRSGLEGASLVRNRDGGDPRWQKWTNDYHNSKPYTVRRATEEEAGAMAAITLLEAYFATVPS